MWAESCLLMAVGGLSLAQNGPEDGDRLPTLALDGFPQASTRRPDRHMTATCYHRPWQANTKQTRIIQTLCAFQCCLLLATFGITLSLGCFKIARRISRPAHVLSRDGLTQIAWDTLAHVGDPPHGPASSQVQVRVNLTGRGLPCRLVL